MKKLFNLFAVILVLLLIVGCGPEPGPGPGPGPGPDPSYSDNPGICNDDFDQVACVDPAGWYDENGVDGKWRFNIKKFDGQGNLPIKIYVGLLEETDPNNANYSGERKEDKRELQSKVEAAYRVKIQYTIYPDNAPWGPSRVNWIIDQKTNNNYLGDIFLIDSNWIPTLAGQNAIAALDNTTQGNTTGLFKAINYHQHPSFVSMTKVGRVVYGYSPGVPRPDTFLYYNQNLVNDLGIEDPATLWNEGKWDYPTFRAFVNDAQSKMSVLGEGYYGFGGDYVEVAQGMISARGYSFITPFSSSADVKLASDEVISMYNDLRTLYHTDKVWEPLGTTTVSEDFKSGRALFSSGDMWFYNSQMRFASITDFKISAVPYPTRAGDGYNKNFYTIPTGYEATWAFREVNNGTYGLNTETLLRIMDDLNRGLKPTEAAVSTDPIAVYRAWLEQRIENVQSVEAIISVQDAPTYLELLEMVSMTAGGGSHYLLDGFWLYGPNFVKKTEINLTAELMSLSEKYKNVVNSIFA